MAQYQSFEVETGACLERVERLCRHLTSGGSFTDATPVTLTDAELALDDAYYFLLGELAKNGYSTSVTATDPLKVLEQIQAYDAAVTVELGMPTNDDGDKNDRYKGMVARRDRMINDYLRGDALEQLGAVRARNKSTYLDASGRSISRKQTVYENTDVNPKYFPRGFGQRKDLPNRSGTQSSGNYSDPDL